MQTKPIFIFYEGQIIEGKISDEIINESLIESLDNLLEKLDDYERMDLYTKIWNLTQND